MACITLYCGHKVRHTFTGCLCAIVTTAAAAGGIGVIKAGRRPRCCAVAIITGVGAGNVCCGFAGGYRAVMASGTSAGNCTVIYGGRCPGYGAVVAIITGIAAGNMR